VSVRSYIKGGGELVACAGYRWRGRLVGWVRYCLSARLGFL